jgi:hypothetical protein
MSGSCFIPRMNQNMPAKPTKISSRRPGFRPCCGKTGKVIENILVSSAAGSFNRTDYGRLAGRRAKLRHERPSRINPWPLKPAFSAA